MVLGPLCPRLHIGIGLPVFTDGAAGDLSGSHTANHRQPGLQVSGSPSTLEAGVSVRKDPPAPTSTPRAWSFLLQPLVHGGPGTEGEGAVSEATFPAACTAA